MAESVENLVWVFHAHGSHYAGGVWPDVASAERCIAKHRLTGVLTAYPLGECCFDWAVRKRCTGMKVGILEEKSRDPAFIGSFTCPAQEHVSYEDGKRK